MMKSGDYSERHLENVNHRLDRVEQILPTLATKEDLKAFPTREEMREAIQEAVGQVRVLFEDQAHLIRLMADNLSAHLHRHETLERRVDGHDVAIESIDLRVRRIEPPRPRRGR